MRIHRSTIVAIDQVKDPRPGFRGAIDRLFDESG